MKTWIRNIAICGGLGVGALFGCNQSAVSSEYGAVSSQALNGREALAYILQDTPYLFMNFDSVPKALWDSCPRM